MSVMAKQKGKKGGVGNVTRDARRLLYTIDLYSKRAGAEGASWMRKDGLDVVVHLGAKSGTFSGYDLAPSLFQYRGVKMFAMLSHEADEDVAVLFHRELVERILLNTWFYATLTGIRPTKRGEELLRDTLTDEDMVSVDRIVKCAKCGQLFDFAASVADAPSVHLVMCRVCSCQTGGKHRQRDDWFRDCCTPDMRINSFFGIGEVEYVASPFFIGRVSNGK